MFKSRSVKLVFILSLIISALIIYFVEKSRYDQKRLLTQHVASNYAHLIKDKILHTLSATTLFPH